MVNARLLPIIAACAAAAVSAKAAEARAHFADERALRWSVPCTDAARWLIEPL
jgi:hypothetical protein